MSAAARQALAFLVQGLNSSYAADVQERRRHGVIIHPNHYKYGDRVDNHDRDHGLGHSYSADGQASQRQSTVKTGKSYLETDSEELMEIAEVVAVVLYRKACEDACGQHRS